MRVFEVLDLKSRFHPMEKRDGFSSCKIHLRCGCLPMGIRSESETRNGDEDGY